MSDKIKELYDGYMEGVFTTKGMGTRSNLISIIIPFRIDMHIEKSKGQVRGEYTFEAHPAIIQPPSMTPLYPGVFDFFPLESYVALPPAIGGSIVKMGPQSLVVGKQSKQGKLDVKIHGGSIIIKFVDIPEKFKVFGSGLAYWEPIVTGQKRIMGSMPLSAQRFEEIGFFSPDATFHLPEFQLEYNHKILGFQAKYDVKKTRGKTYPIGAIDHYRAETVIVKTQSSYLVTTYDEHYVKQEGLEEVRQVFLDNPDLIPQLEAAAEREIQEGVREGLVSPRLVNMLESMEESMGDPASKSDSTVESVDIAGPKKRSKHPRPREGLAYALGKLTTIAKGGNYCMTVVDDCWVNFRYKKKGNHLYFQVAGDKYIPKRSHFEKKHIEILKKMGIVAEPMSDDIFSTHFDDKPRNLKGIVDTVFEIFSKVYRVRKSADAYIKFVIGSKPSAEMASAVEGMHDYFSDRDGKDKFCWNWSA